MRSYCLALVTFASAVTLLGQTSNPPAATTPTAPTKETQPLCTISGRVITSAEGSPLRGARAALMPLNSSSDQHMYAAVSDDDGRFLVKDVPAGKYTFFAVRAGYVQQHYKSHGTDEGAVLTLSPGQKLTKCSSD
jgi:5-hydroxyisourate hydrolase-like protein (transthyretin family)